MASRRWAVLTTALILLCGSGLEAQERPRGEFEEEIQVTEVLLDVLVTDRKGNIVLGLDKDDFLVREEGEPVEISAVTFYSNRDFLGSSEQAEELGIDPSGVPAERYFILFFHNQRQLFPRLVIQQLDAGRWAKRWARGSLLPNDYAAVVSYEYSLKLHQDFTNDREAITAAINAAVTGKDPEPKQVTAGGEGGSPSLFAPFAGTSLREPNRIQEALEMIGRAADHVRGRKNLVLFSVGFGDIGTLGVYTPDPRYYPRMMRSLNDGNVAVYPIDLVPTSADGGLLTNLLANSLSNLAADTGGRYYFNFVNFLTPLEQISQDTNGYYLLAYRSRHPAGARGFQEVRVETRNPEFRVRARAGYFYGEEGR